MFVDVTELRRLESLRRDFVANASHELRTPIAAVRSATETLRNGALDDPTGRRPLPRHHRAQRRSACRASSRTCSTCPSWSPTSSSSSASASSSVAWCPSSWRLFRERAEKKGVRLSAEMPAEPLAVEGDARGLEHVLSNLVDNAVKYCPAGARIVVKAVAGGRAGPPRRVRHGPRHPRRAPAAPLRALLPRRRRPFARARRHGPRPFHRQAHGRGDARRGLGGERRWARGSTFTVSLGAAESPT